MKTLTVHMIANSHLDPVWLWRWPASIDEAINTSRKVCQFLDEYNQFIFTRGEAWLYSVIEEHDPPLFKRIKKHVEEGRWSVVNGWWIQSDCNFPLKESFLKQAEIGKRYFRDKFGKDVTVGYNVDSFGHTGYLPAILKQSGFDSYIFMRPQMHEKELPVNLFKWKSPSGESVTTFRLGRRYETRSLEELQLNVKEAVELANRDIGHTMCFFGIGDHGGAVSREMIEWIIANEHYTGNPAGDAGASDCNPADSTQDDEVRLVFSDPYTYFKEVVASGVDLPVIEDEMQYHAIGAYTAAHRFRQKVRKSEWLALQAENVEKIYQAESASEGDAETSTTAHGSSSGTAPEKHYTAALAPIKNDAAAWKNILFNQFHDIMGGCCIRSAYDDAFEEIGAASSFFKNIMITHSRKLLLDFPEDSRQRLLLFNAWDKPFDGYLEIEPWLGYSQIIDLSPERFRFVDQNGNEVPSQPVQKEAASPMTSSFLIRANIPAQGTRIVAIETRDRDSKVDEKGIKGKGTATGTPIHQSAETNKSAEANRAEKIRAQLVRNLDNPSDAVFEDRTALDNGNVKVIVNQFGIDRIEYVGASGEDKSKDKGEDKKERSAPGARSTLQPLSLLNDIAVTVYEDDSDTWSHGFSSYEGAAVARFRADGGWKLIEDGPIRQTVSAVLTAAPVKEGDSDASRESNELAGTNTRMEKSQFRASNPMEKDLLGTNARMEWKVSLYRDEPAVHLRLRLYWQGVQKIVKLELPPTFTVARRIDGVPGGPLERKIDGQEYPVQNVISLYPAEPAPNGGPEGGPKGGLESSQKGGPEGGPRGESVPSGNVESPGGLGFSCISGDFYAVDVRPDGTARITLLRSSYYAHHHPFEPKGPYGYPVEDQGVHDYDITLLLNRPDQTDEIEKYIVRMIDPVWMSETTKGM